MLTVTYYLIPGLLMVQLAMGSSVYFNRLLPAVDNCFADSREPWGYRPTNGPLVWGRNYPDCNGREQSPININRMAVVKDANLTKLVMNNYNTTIEIARIENNGHTVQVTPEDDVERSITIGNSTYTFRQLHFHWGYMSRKGAEHTIDGMQYALEMHLVHMNENNEIAVVGVIFQERGPVNSELDNIVMTFPEVLYKDTETQIKNLTLNNLLPENPASFYRYNGSLTTPGCAEGVTWSVLTNFLTVGPSQMKQFRQLYSVREEDALPICRLLYSNYRPVQRLNGRTVYVSQ